MSAVAFPALFTVMGLSAPSLPSSAAASQDSLPDLITLALSEPAASPCSLAVFSLSDNESDAGVYSLGANSWVASEWRETVQRGQFDPVIINIVMTVSDDHLISPISVPPSDPAPTAPTTTWAFHARKLFCFCCCRLGHVVKDCRDPHPLRNWQTAWCSGGPPPVSNCLPAQGWDTHHDAWDIVDPIDQCLDPTANAFHKHWELLCNHLCDTDAAIHKLLEQQKYWSDRLWEVEWKNPPCPLKEEVRGTRHDWRDKEDWHDPSWSLPSWDY
ncbi:hypothetical protein EWM64_g2226 [Hericium alpestre]|uniref:CCHC-type domain-containing protein n=1 Tax=Hericium alpestre TaxID=135208 RepID=A0A4Z0A6A7_9AGAM|nr:hypothetical protein EWM64_g2226 [Hericium alpestre]